MKDKGSLIRSTWPRIRIITVKREKFYQVDARPSGRRKAYRTEKEAREYANERAALKDNVGVHADSLDAVTLEMVKQALAKLLPYGASPDTTPTIMDAVNHYTGFLDLRDKAKGKRISTLANEWHNSRKEDKNKPLRSHTLRGIEHHSKLLKAHFGNLLLHTFTTEVLQKYLNSLQVGQRRRHHIVNLTGQFFNWCIKNKYTRENPAAEIEIHVPKTDIQILTSAQAEKHLITAQQKFPEFTEYVAISLFAGLRPFECLHLKWEQIHLEEKQITVLGGTSKVKETRNVPIEENLLAWLQAFEGERAGYVTRQANFQNKIKKYRAALGYKINRENEAGEPYSADTYRHSYGSYWLGKNQDRAHLAENMGTSLQMIKKHYKAVVTPSAVEAFWKITPTTVKKGIKEEAARAAGSGE